MAATKPKPIDAKTLIDVAGLEKQAGNTKIEIGMHQIVLTRKDKFGVSRVTFDRPEWDLLARWYTGNK